MKRHFRAAVPAVIFLVLGVRTANAEELKAAPAQARSEQTLSAPTSPEQTTGEHATPTQTAAPPPPYSLPWQLRPVTAGTVVRSDSSVAGYEAATSRPGTTTVTTLGASYKIPGTGGPGSGLAPLLRLGFVNDSPPSGSGGLTFMNPLVGASFALKLPSNFRLALSFAVTVPVGGGGGDSPDPGNVNSRSKGIFARASMDNAMFAVNDFTLIPGLGFAYIGHGLTLQAEVTLLELLRVRGENSQADTAKTNLTSGIHVGYFFTGVFSFGADLRYQRWLVPPGTIEKLRAANDDSAMDNTTFALGPRVHIKVGKSSWIRPGLSYGRGLDKPTNSAGSNYQIVQLDVPIQF